MRKISKRYETEYEVKQGAKIRLFFVTISLILAKHLDVSQGATIPACKCIEHVHQGTRLHAWYR
jgi:hypothetical protein